VLALVIIGFSFSSS